MSGKLLEFPENRTLDQIVIGLDCDGGDPLSDGTEVWERAFCAAERFVGDHEDTTIVMATKEERLQNLLEKHDHPQLKLKKVNGWYQTELIKNPSRNENEEEDHRKIISLKGSRSKKDTAVYSLFKMHKEGKLDGVFTVLDTGTAVKMIPYSGIKRAKGVKRAPMIVKLPGTPGNSFYLLDAGANLLEPSQQEEYGSLVLTQQARMGAIYAREMDGIAVPRVGFLAVGTEDHKVTRMIQQAIENCAVETTMNVVGPVETYCGINGRVDIIVADGGAGNKSLKSFEAGSYVAKEHLKEGANSYWPPLSWIAKLGTWMSARKAKKNIGEEKFAGSPFLGLDGVIYESHATTSENGFYHGMARMRYDLTNGISKKVREELKNQKVPETKIRVK